MKLSNETIEEIKSRIDAVDVIGDFVQLKRAGQNFKALSPFSDEKTPSFFVFPKNNNFKDFSSGKQGDAITFIMELEGLGYMDALLYLAKKYGIEVVEEHQTEEEIQRQTEREGIFIALGFARDYFVKQLHESEEGKQALSYFDERGFSQEIMRKFELGYSPRKWDSLVQAARDQGYSEEVMEKAGLIVQSDRGTRDRFFGRVMFPIHNTTGKPIAFGARIIGRSQKQPKYLNSPETPVYHKSNILYGLYQAKRAIRAADNCYLVEGYTDVISLHKCGVENVVSSSGTSLTDQQVKLISRHTQNITVLFDGDAAGARASLRGIDIILAQGMHVKTVMFPEGEDPDSYARKLGAMGFRSYLEDKATDFIQFKTAILLQDKETDPVAKAATISQVVSSIALIPDAVLRTVYLQNTSSQLGIEEEVLYAELNKHLLGQSREDSTKSRSTTIPVEETLPVEQKKTNPVELQERETVRLLINYGFNQLEDSYHLCDHYLDELADIEFSNSIYNEILQLFREHLNRGKVIDADYLIRNSAKHIREEVMEIVSEKHALSENWDKRYRIYVPREEEILSNSVYTNILRLKFYKVKKLIDLHLEQIKGCTSEEKLADLMKVYMELKKAEGEFARPLGIVVSG